MTTTTNPTRNGQTPADRAAASRIVPPPANPCPVCGGGRGLNNRCYTCNPWHRHGQPAGAGGRRTDRERPEKNVCPQCSGRKPRHHRWCAACEKVAVSALKATPTRSAAAEPPPASPRGVDEIRALAQVVATLERIDDADARLRVLAFVSSRFAARPEPSR